MNRKKLFRIANNIAFKSEHELKQHADKYMHAMHRKTINEIVLKWNEIYGCNYAPINILNIAAPYLSRRTIQSLHDSALQNSVLLRRLPSNRLSDIAKRFPRRHMLDYLPDLTVGNIVSDYAARDVDLSNILLSRYIYKMVVQGKYHSADSLLFVCDIENSTRICRMIRKLSEAAKDDSKGVSRFGLISHLPYREDDSYLKRLLYSNMFSILPPKYAIAAFDLLRCLYSSRTYFATTIIEHMCHAHYKFYNHVLSEVMRLNIKCPSICISRLLRNRCLRARITRKLRIDLVRTFYLDAKMFLENKDIEELHRMKLISTIRTFGE